MSNRSRRSAVQCPGYCAGTREEGKQNFSTGGRIRAYLPCEMVTELLPNPLRSIFPHCHRSARAATQSLLCVDGYLGLPPGTGRGLGVGLGLTVGVGLAVGVGVELGVTVGVGVGVGVGPA